MNDGVRVFDLRGEQENPAPHSKLDWRGRTLRRDPLSITGVTIHQTAVAFSVSPAQVKAAGGDRRWALARRGLKVPAHAEAFRDGTVAITDDVDAYLNHAGKLNGSTVGEEIDGLYPGLLDRPETAPREDLRSTWGDREPQRFEGPIVEAAKAALVWLVTQARVAGARSFRYVRAHRQSEASRRSDPGEEIWRVLVLDFAVKELGLVVEQGRTWGTGKPIPLEWDPNGVGRY